jgi:hypothetical protein
MRSGIVLDANDVRRIIAEHFSVPESNVIKSQYSYTVITEESDKCEESKSD